MSESKPFFSVVMPLFNKQSHVKETIETALAQIFQDFEIVVVNDGSTDDSLKVVETIKDSRIRIINQTNAGVSVARNKGIKESKGNFIVFLDADDLWLPHFLSRIFNLIENYPKAGLYATSYFLNDGKENKSINIKGVPNKHYIGYIQNYFKSKVLGEYLVWTSAVCIPRNIFFESDIWFPDGKKYGEDQYVWGRIAILYKIVYDTKESAIYNTKTENNTAAGINSTKMPQETVLSLAEYMDQTYSKDIRIWYEKYRQVHIMHYIVKNKKNSDIKNALKIIYSYKLSLKSLFKALAIIFLPQQLFRYLINRRRKILLGLN